MRAARIVRGIHVAQAEWADGGYLGDVFAGAGVMEMWLAAW